MLVLMLFGTIGSSYDALDAKSVREQIASSNEDIQLRINSAGGRVVEGFAIVAAVNEAKAAGRKVEVIIDGVAASMASLIAMVGDTIAMSEDGLFMIHNPSGEAYGDAEGLRKQAGILDKMTDRMVAAYVARTGQSEADIRALMDAETWMNAEEALAAGFITSIIKSDQTTAAVDVSKFGACKSPDHPLIVKAPKIPAKDVLETAVADANVPKEKTVDPKIIARILAFTAAHNVAKALESKALTGEITFDEMVDQHTAAISAAATAAAGAAGAEATSIPVATIQRIMAYSATHKVSKDLEAKALTGGITFDQMVDQHTDAVAEAAKASGVNNVRVGQTLDASPDQESKLRADALAFRTLNVLGFKGQEISDQAKTYLNDDLEDAARFVLRANDISDTGMKRDAVMDMATGVRATITSRSLNHLMTNVVNTIFMDGYQSMAPRTTFTEWAGEMLVPSFEEVKASYAIIKSGIADMAEGEPFPLAQLGEGAVFVKLQTRGMEMQFTRQARLADQFNLFAKAMRNTGSLFKRDEENIVVKALTVGKMKTDAGIVNIFTQAKNNLITAAALDPDAIKRAKETLRKQKNVEGHIMEFEPRYLIVSPDLDDDADRVTSPYWATEFAKVTTSAKLGLKKIVINGLPEKTAYLTDEKELAEIISYLRLASAPGVQIITLEDPRRQAMGFCAYNDFAAKGVNDRGWVKIEIQ